MVCKEKEESKKKKNVKLYFARKPHCHFFGFILRVVHEKKWKTLLSVRRGVLATKKNRYTVLISSTIGYTCTHRKHYKNESNFFCNWTKAVVTMSAPLTTHHNGKWVNAIVCVRHPQNKNCCAQINIGVRVHSLSLSWHFPSDNSTWTLILH